MDKLASPCPLFKIAAHNLAGSSIEEVESKGLQHENVSDKFVMTWDQLYIDMNEKVFKVLFPQDVLERLTKDCKTFESLHNVKVVFLNGPPYSGKDAAGAWLQTLDPKDFALFKCAAPIKIAAHNLAGSSAEEVEQKGLKDQKISDKFNMTWRELYIDMSEKVFKPMFGKDVMGKFLRDSINACDCQVAIVTDCGFLDEARVIIEAFGAQKVLLIRCHRKGKSFVGDSRSYLSIEGVTDTDLFNDASLLEWQKQTHEFVSSWLAKSAKSAVTCKRKISQV